jgi:hypothetical protein
MATKTIIIGEKPSTKEVKKIEFDTFLTEDNIFEECANVGLIPSSFKFIELITKKYNMDNQDLMFAYDDPNDRSAGFLMLGWWNNGIV